MFMTEQPLFLKITLKFVKHFEETLKMFLLLFSNLSLRLNELFLKHSGVLVWLEYRVLPCLLPEITSIWLH